jgi:hypothetical protein
VKPFDWLNEQLGLWLGYISASATECFFALLIIAVYLISTATGCLELEEEERPIFSDVSVISAPYNPKFFNPDKQNIEKTVNT